MGPLASARDGVVDSSRFAGAAAGGTRATGGRGVGLGPAAAQEHDERQPLQCSAGWAHHSTLSHAKRGARCNGLVP